MKKVMGCLTLLILAGVLSSCNGFFKENGGEGISISIPSRDFILGKLSNGRSAPSDFSACPLTIIVKELDSKSGVVLEEKRIAYKKGDDSPSSVISFKSLPIDSVVSISIVVSIGEYEIQKMVESNLSTIKLYACDVFRGEVSSIRIRGGAQSVLIPLRTTENAFILELTNSDGPGGILVLPIYPFSLVDDFCSTKEKAQAIAKTLPSLYDFQWWAYFEGQSESDAIKASNPSDPEVGTLFMYLTNDLQPGIFYFKCVMKRKSDNKEFSTSYVRVEKRNEQ